MWWDKQKGPQASRGAHYSLTTVSHSAPACELVHILGQVKVKLPSSTQGGVSLLFQVPLKELLVKFRFSFANPNLKIDFT